MQAVSCLWLSAVLLAAEPAATPTPPLEDVPAAGLLAPALEAAAWGLGTGSGAPLDGFGEAEGEEEDEAEDHEAQGRGEAEEPGVPGRRYSADLSDAELERRWKDARDALGSLSIGFTDAGRLINGVRFPPGPHWTVVDPPRAWGTEEVVGFIQTAATEVARLFPGSPPLRVNHLSGPEGGWLRPHASHQSGRDVDLGFYRTPQGPDPFDVQRNWALVRALATLTDVQVILLDRRLQRRLYDYALSVGEDPAWLDSLFRAGKASLVQHAKRHRDHYHVRFYSARAQELGRRLQPLLPRDLVVQKPRLHRIRPGEVLGSIARKHGVSVATLRKANGLKGNGIRAGRTLRIPVRGPCVACPTPPEVVVPSRRLPPSTPALFARPSVASATAAPPLLLAGEGASLR